MESSMSKKSLKIPRFTRDAYSRYPAFTAGQDRARRHLTIAETVQKAGGGTWDEIRALVAYLFGDRAYIQV